MEICAKNGIIYLYYCGGGKMKELEERILKEMNYLMQEHYQLEEDHYKKLDEAIRSNLRKKRSRGVKWILPTRKSENREK